MFLYFETLRTETATEKINKLRIDHSVQSTPDFSVLDGYANRNLAFIV